MEFAERHNRRRLSTQVKPVSVRVVYKRSYFLYKVEREKTVFVKMCGSSRLSPRASLSFHSLVTIFILIPAR